MPKQLSNDEMMRVGPDRTDLPKALDYVTPEKATESRAAVLSRRICAVLVGIVGALAWWVGIRLATNLMGGSPQADAVTGLTIFFFAVGIICTYAFIRWLMVEFGKPNHF